MKLLTLNFLTCATAPCKKVPHLSFPLHPHDAELEVVELDYNPIFLRNVMPRVEWAEMGVVCSELGLTLPAKPPLHPTTSEDEEIMTDQEAETTLRALHRLLIETRITTGSLVCGNCGHSYAIKEGIANFLLPAHMV